MVRSFGSHCLPTFRWIQFIKLVCLHCVPIINQDNRLVERAKCVEQVEICFDLVQVPFSGKVSSPIDTPRLSLKVVPRFNICKASTQSMYSLWGSPLDHSS